MRQGGVLGYAMMHSGDTGSALRRLNRFSRLISTSIDFELIESPETWRIVSTRPPLAPSFRAPVDASAAMLVTVLRQITGRQIDPLLTSFTYPRPSDLTRLRAVLRGELEFGVSRDSIAFRARDMEIPLLQPEERLAHYLDRLADQDLAKLPRWDTFSRRVGRTVWQHLSEGQPTVARVAREIGLSSRTLQRRLREEGTTFAQVVDDLRRQLAPTLLRDQSLAVYEIAYLLGYADPSAFFRAFRRWHGFSPARYRRLAPESADDAGESDG